MTAELISTLVKVCHRLVGTTDLHLHEIGAVVVAGRTRNFSRVHVLPRFLSAKNDCVDFLKIEIYFKMCWLWDDRHRP